ncbi:hypothetical protein SUGI_0977850 [Cryptomeria japonica]|nr:hypothetical protein SUGI_0977850 [Cryptomeria japonica]
MAGLVREASSKSNPASFNNTIKVCKQEHSRQALQIFHTLEDVIDSSTYISLLQACSKHKALPEGKLIHAHINVSTNLRVLMTDPIIHNSLITMYVKCDELESARRVFDEMQRRNSCSWSVMIAAYAKHGFLVQEALLLFRQMQENYVKCNEFTYSSVLPACAKLGSLKLGMEVHKQVIERGFQSDLVVANALVDMYAKCGSVEDARQVFDKMPEPNVVSWTAMIAGYSKLGNLKEALILFQKMPYKDQFARTAMIAAYAENGMVDAAWKLDVLDEVNCFFCGLYGVIDVGIQISPCGHMNFNDRAAAYGCAQLRVTTGSYDLLTSEVSSSYVESKHGKKGNELFGLLKIIVADFDWAFLRFLNFKGALNK